MQSDEVRKRYLAFFEKRGHIIVSSSLIVPENDPTTLFTGSGMQSMLPFLLGEKHPLGSRITDSQKCFRAEDIEEVGDNRHTTFFEMLGNWSFGDYFNHEQLPWIFEFLIQEIGLDPNRLFVTVFLGDEKNDLSRDITSAEIWKQLFAEKDIEARDIILGTEERAAQVGMQDGRIFYYDAKKNWWSRTGVPDNMPAGEPGGPCSEMFYDFGTTHDEKYGKHCHPNCDCGRFVEIGNNVFMKYKKTSAGKFEELPQKNVDFGGGLERIVAATNNNSDVFKIDALNVIVKQIESLTNVIYKDSATTTQSFRIIADHIRGAVFMIEDGVLPSNTDAGYFVRRLLRRAARHMDLLGMKENMLFKLVPTIIQAYSGAYPELASKGDIITKEIQQEEERFRKTLQQGLARFEKIKEKDILGKVAFDLYQSYGFPLELSKELALEKGMSVDEEGFRQEMKKHQETSRVGAEQKFKGGLADTGDKSIKYHTATHLLHQALRVVLGEEVEQKGSNITNERLRFDFTYSRKMTEEERKQTEDLVNQKIAEALSVTYEDMLLESARTLGAIGLFGDKYGDTVRVYKIGAQKNFFSIEICGGPHATNTKELGSFRIIKEEASSAGVRRIKAVLSVL
ncbi:alanine--tRNA ligase [Patescibacteria group bacterium]|nr:alanine--tRNA ligase [Patescibacteria group bacterium]MBU1730561.1 alanine--tRNA ligase [Patescibacteria group bacterium]MBU1956253.1 alanine--tRNA ligase [Patescibacteria group bacterium]MBU2010155.1 alanine--tRNA ligase [Patescibacteria group bacterium]